MARDRKSPCTADRSDRRRAAVADSATQEDQCHPKKIFVGGLAHKTSTQDLRDYFVRYGAVVDAVVLRWPDGRSRGFGYVTFAEADPAALALGEAHQVGGREVDVKRAVPGTNKLFVGGLPQNTPAAELREHFEAFGVVSDAVVMIDPTTNRSRGFGFVCFLPGQEGAAAVAAALEQYQNHRIRGKWIEVKSAAPPHKLAAGEGQDAAPHSSPGGKAHAAKASPPAVKRPPGLKPMQQPTGGEPQRVSFSGVATSASPTTKSNVEADLSTPPGLQRPSPASTALPAHQWGPTMPTTTLLQWMCPSPCGLGAVPTFKTQNRSLAAHADPQKVPVLGEVDLWADQSYQCKSGMSAATQELQRSLEKLLMLQSKQVDARAGEGSAHLLADSSFAKASIMLEAPESPAKMES